MQSTEDFPGILLLANQGKPLFDPLCPT